MKDTRLSNKQAALIKALRLLLKPLVRLMIQQQMTFPLLRELLKQVYLEQATDLIEQDGGTASHSRLYIATGIHRKDIKRLSETAPADTGLTENLSLSDQLIVNWLTLPQYLDSENNPRPLSFMGDKETPGFAQLVSSVSKDIRPRALLDEWSRQGIVSQRGREIALNPSAYMANEQVNRMLDHFGAHIHDHMAAISHNMLHDANPMFERSLYYGRLTPKSIETLKRLAEMQGDELLQNLNLSANRLYQQDREKSGATQCFRLGCYWFHNKQAL